MFDYFDSSFFSLFCVYSKCHITELKGKYMAIDSMSMQLPIALLVYLGFSYMYENWRFSVFNIEKHRNGC